MIRAALSLVLSLALALASYVLADARGASHDVGLEIVICSGVGMTTISVGPDGQPVEKTEPCPDGTSIFTATFALPELPEPEARLVAWVAPIPGRALAGHDELIPSARGPPALA
jgi:hypothetical protein